MKKLFVFCFVVISVSGFVGCASNKQAHSSQPAVIGDSKQMR